MDHAFAEQLSPYDADGCTPGRVTRVDRGALTVLTEHGPIRASARRKGADATVGDWVAVRPDGPDGLYEVAALAERRSAFTRRAAGGTTEEQVVAANVDVVLIVVSLAAKLSPRRTERYLALAWQSGATPVVVLSKADLCDDLPLAVASVEAVAFGVPVVPVSAVTGEGLDELRAHVAPGRTVAFLGLSGVGKSTLVNTLAGSEVLRVQDVRGDGKGRHTTTHRELVVLPQGGVLLDTPGMRGLLLWDASEGVEQAFGDVEEVAAQCRFADCGHETEPGCAVRAALRDGRLSHTRYDSWCHLQRELRNLEMRQDHRLRSEERRKWRIRERSMRLRERLGD
jgi:ribosome biogenesis GTPase / thiamine phosphate phosphatase